jgi:hypothetical protein
MLMEDGSEDYWSHTNKIEVAGALIAAESAKTFGLSRASKDFASKKTFDRQPTQESSQREKRCNSMNSDKMS